MVAMTRFHGRFTGWQSKVVILRLKSPSRPQMRKTSKPYHSVFLTHFDLRICYLPLYYLLTFLYQPRPVYPTIVSYYCLMVPVAGLEPAQCCHRGIFLLLYVTIATFLCCSLEYVFIICTTCIQIVGIYSLHIYLEQFFPR